MKLWHALVALFAIPLLAAQTIPYQGPAGGGYSMSNPLPAMTLPFRRAHSAPIRLKALGTTPKTFPISRPPNATTYRIVNPCDEDIRLLGTMSANDNVTVDTGDHLIILPTAPASLGAGYAVHHAFPTASNTLRVVLQASALAVLGSYSIPVAVYAVNR
jgi:hypothetical protein